MRAGALFKLLLALLFGVLLGGWIQAASTGESPFFFKPFIERVRWPDVPSPPWAETLARQHLDRILALAAEDLDQYPSNGDPEVERLRGFLEEVIGFATACRDAHADWHDGLSPELQDWHAIVVDIAREQATQAAKDDQPLPEKTVFWRVCRDELDHLEGGMRNG